MDRTYNNHMIVVLAMHKPVYTVYRYIVNINNRLNLSITNSNIINIIEWYVCVRVCVCAHARERAHGMGEVLVGSGPQSFCLAIIWPLAKLTLLYTIPSIHTDKNIYYTIHPSI